MVVAVWMMCICVLVGSDVCVMFVCTFASFSRMNSNNK